MPESFDAAQKKLGRAQTKPYVPLAVRENAGNTGLLANLPGSYTNATGGNANANNAPPKATAAPKGNTNEVFTGLAEALNTHQLTLVKDKKQSRADEYVIEFAPATLGDARVKRQGSTNKKATPMQNDNSAKKLDAATNSTNVNARSMQVSAGMQIVQFIDEIMRSSSYITDQQLYIVDEVTQKVKLNPSPPSGQVAWYKISVEAVQLGYDKIRNDQAYRMKFVISPYAINAAPSDWFGNSRYRGSHKSYEYWFSGMNTQILSFDQEYNNLYRLIISGANVPVQSAKTDFRDQSRRVYFPTSEQHAKGAEGYTNEGADNLAGFLYSPTDQAKARLRIIGDPAWMQQGEISTGVSAATFNFRPFNDDGTINYDSQEIVFDVSWNRPQDYNFDTGLMDINRSNYDASGSYSNQPQENATYTAIKCKNIFSKGKFEQDLEGRLLIEVDKNANQASNNTVADRPNTAKVTSSRAPTQLNQSEFTSDTATSVKPEDRNISETAPADATTDTNINPQSAPDPEPATSNGDIVSFGYQDEAQQAADGLGAGVEDNPINQYMNRDE